MADLARLRSRARAAFPRADSMSFMTRVRAIVASAQDLPPDEQGRLAAAALRKLEGEEDGDPSPRELAALELMIRMTRPAPLVHSSVPDDFRKPEHSEIFPQWREFRDSVKPFMSAVGRIDSFGPSLSAAATVGTGFLVQAGVLVTNKHVLNDLSRAQGVLEPGQAVVRFRFEADSFDENVPKRIMAVAAVHQTVDAVLLRVEDALLPADNPYPKLDACREDERDVAVAGYPAEKSDRNPLFIRSAFGDNLGVLRAAPGRVSESSPAGFAHDCSTLGGNSGSPVFRVATAEVIGLHTGGSFLWKNYAVDGLQLAEFVREKTPN
jgi:S1-C subfamily serine protease